MLTDDFTFVGPILQAKNKADFLAGSAGLGPMVRGCHMHRQWVDGDEVCSIYDFKVETPMGSASIPMAEWSVVRNGKLVSSRLLFDTAAMTALMPPLDDMPKAPWTGYGRFCPLARALDVVGDRWTLVIMQELMKRPSRYSDLSRRLPGISTTVLAERLRKLETAGVVERRAAGVGEGVVYEVTEKGNALADGLMALRRWGVEFLTDPAADGAEHRVFDLHYVEGIDRLHDVEFGLTVDGKPTTLRFAGGYLEQTPGQSFAAKLAVTTTAAFHGSLGCRPSELGRGSRRSGGHSLR